MNYTKIVRLEVLADGQEKSISIDGLEARYVNGEVYVALADSKGTVIPNHNTSGTISMRVSYLGMKESIVGGEVSLANVKEEYTANRPNFAGLADKLWLTGKDLDIQDATHLLVSVKRWGG